jgi:hypothetical protein
VARRPSWKGERLDRLPPSQALAGKGFLPAQSSSGSNACRPHNSVNEPVTSTCVRIPVCPSAGMKEPRPADPTRDRPNGAQAGTQGRLAAKGGRVTAQRVHVGTDSG